MPWRKWLRYWTNLRNTPPPRRTTQRCASCWPCRASPITSNTRTGTRATRACSVSAKCTHSSPNSFRVIGRSRTPTRTRAPRTTGWSNSSLRASCTSPAWITVKRRPRAVPRRSRRRWASAGCWTAAWVSVIRTWVCCRGCRAYPRRRFLCRLSSARSTWTWRDWRGLLWRPRGLSTC